MTVQTVVVFLVEIRSWNGLHFNFMELTLDRMIKDLSCQNSRVISVFLTDVEGLYDRPPNSDGQSPPRVIPQIFVTQDGQVIAFLLPL